MLDQFKKVFYFFTAWYFRFWAQIRLNAWKPRIIVVTGSSGKTTLLHFVESQLIGKAKISHHANSSIGVPFDILGLERKTLAATEWPGLILFAPLNAFSKPPEEKIYVVECDCDRPNEGKFLAEFLKPEVTLWISLSRTHATNFDELVEQKKFPTVEDAIAYEFGYFLQHTTKAAIINGDSQYMLNQKQRTSAQIIEIDKQSSLQEYSLTHEGTHFVINHQAYNLPQLHPQEVFYTIAMTKALLEFLNLPFDSHFAHLHMPPGRTTVFQGIKNTTLIDSTYNANLISMKAILDMFAQIAAEKKWVVLGDMRELGKEEAEEHQKLAEILAQMQLQKVLLLGDAITQYTYPHLQKLLSTKSNTQPELLKFETHPQLLEYLQKNIQGGETILFKASQSPVFEGFIEPLLLNPGDAKKLPRREISWTTYRQQKGFAK